jgi:ABC-type antimicrobial peptide transport system permease subunit
LQTSATPGNAMLVRFAGNAAEVKLAIRKEISGIDPRITSAPGTLASLIAKDAEPFGKLLQLVLFLGAVATLMVVVGIYGVAAFSVRQRSRELGIRVALGATRAEIVRLVLVTGTGPVAAGLVLGMGLAVAAAVPLAMAFKGTPVRLPTGDWIAYIGSAVVLVIAATAAMFGPAMRAAAADPVKALRQE